MTQQDLFDKEADVVTEEKAPEPNEDQVEIKYGLTIYLDTTGEYHIELHNQENCSLTDLIGLVQIAEQKVKTIWDSKYSPATQAIFRELAILKQASTVNDQTIKAILEVLSGLNTFVADIHEIVSKDSHVVDAEVVDASEAQD